MADGLSNRNVRRPLVCEWCRKRKKKCDRHHPCGPCISRGLAASCVFEVPQSILEVPPQSKHSIEPERAQFKSGLEAGVEPRDVVTGQLFQYNSRPGSEYSMPAHWVSMLYQSKEFRSDVENTFGCLTDNPPARSNASNAALLNRFPSAPAVEFLTRIYILQVHPHFPILDADDVVEQSNSVWINGEAASCSFLSVMAAVLACAAHTLSDGLANQQVDLMPLDCLVSDPNPPSQPSEISTYLMSLLNDILEAYDFSINPDLNTIQALLLRQYYLTIFLGDGERANPQLWMTVNLAGCIGLHRDGSLYGLSPLVVERRKSVWAGVHMLQSDLVLFYGKPFIPKSKKSDAQFPRASPNQSQSLRQYSSFLNQQCRMASLTLKIFDTIYSITTGDYSVVDSLDAEIRECGTQWSLNEIRDLIRTAPSVDCIRAVNSLIHQSLLVLLTHRPWAARGFRDSKYYKSSIASRDAARDILILISSLDWFPSPQGHIYEVHLGAILVRASFHALSMLLMALLTEGNKEGAGGSDDITLITSALSKCDYLARRMPDRTKVFLNLMRKLIGRVSSPKTLTAQMPSGDNEFTDAGPSVPTDLSSADWQSMDWCGFDITDWPLMGWFDTGLSGFENWNGDESGMNRAE
ncbi:hypothetical protein B0O99DRAFT_647224 [Bisporella sp. PMI_857]|nr:hypothetical protein B0O99DRAFT_647224 [Bisporella sp. PMI_857]